MQIGTFYHRPHVELFKVAVAAYASRGVYTSSYERVVAVHVDPRLEDGRGDLNELCIRTIDVGRDSVVDTHDRVSATRKGEDRRHFGYSHCEKYKI